MDSTPLEVTFDNVLSEHLAADRLHYRLTRMSKVDKVAAVVLVAIGLYFTISYGILWWTIIWFPLAVAEWFNVFSIRPIQIWYFFKNNPKLVETYNLSFDESGIHFRTRTLDSRLRWDHYNSILENHRLFLLIYGSRMYTVIPKRAFKSKNELVAFRNLVTSKISKSS